MTPRDDDSDDDLTALFGATGGDAPPPDPDFLAQLRDRSTDAFVGAAPAPSPPTKTAPNRRFPMLAILLRASTAAVAAALLIGLAVRFSTTDEPALLTQSLDRFADADTLHLKVIQNANGPTHDIWVAKGNKLRWEDTAEKYQIVQGPNSYRVDEAANRVTSGIADYFRPDRPGVDVFALLGLQRPSPDTIKDVKPSHNHDLRAPDGGPAEVYRIETADRSGGLRVVDVVIDARTRDLSMVQVLAPNPVQNQRLELVTSLLVLAQGQPVPEEKFAVKPTLAEDGRVGKIVDVQGLVSVKPVTYARWTPVRPGLLLMPGDWVRADIRGANAATMRLLPQALITVGPGGLLEVTKPNQIKLHEGEAEITPAKKVPVELTAPNGEKVTITERTHYRVEKEQLVKVEKEPLWLKGFKGTTNNESLGSLVAKVDGRNVPLSVGYHKVTVEIRDQIARTVIEESFVNHTNTQLEGQFHFPLPQDASIAGFAMDVNGEMVEADVVEKQRAREIYEEIMRERRDPGLLEWTGGNIFKARVWPIFAHSEKRIKITYTQVLPLQGKQYRYSYALQSEMLQLNPLKELALTVHVSSAVPLKSVTSPTHSVRTQKTDYAAKLEFSAQEHTPTKDFEAVIEVADAAPNVAVIPHRRGADGYFLVQVTPPAGAAQDRALIASADALNLMLVCDTSASMDPAQRNVQHALAASLLEALTPKDTFNLAACDVNADWAFDRPQQATPENITKARAFLMGRVSLGWTDLDKAFASALQQVGAKGHVVYLGDGIITTGNANPQEFAQRLTNLYKASNTTATFHAVALSSAFEPPVLKAIGSLGSGSVRRVTTEQGPVPVALELLSEITRPPVRDLRVEFKNWKTASVYPETLTNLVPGTQQILIGRYLPEGADQLGEVVVTGVQNGQAVRYTAKATLKDAEAGNSFLPRLWARMHLDKLLEKPQTQLVKDDIIALSEEFHIMTPYTSFLVLESDADRERFKVKRRFLMRDGEQFFAAGRDKADFELAREQMKKAGEWRTGLRRDVLSLFNTLGRPSPQASRGRYDRYREYELTKNQLGRLSEDFDGGESDYLNLFGRPNVESAFLGDDSGAWGTRFKGKRDVADLPDLQKSWNLPEGTAGGLPDPDAIRLGAGEEMEIDRKQLLDANLDLLSQSSPQLYYEALAARAERGLESANKRRAGLTAKPAANQPYYRMAGGMGGRAPSGPAQPQRWFDTVIPTVPEPVKATPPKQTWPQEAHDLARTLRRQETLAKLAGVAIERQTTAYDASGEAVSRDQTFELLSPMAWLVRTAGDANPTLTQWCDGTDRGAYMAAWLLGRVRAAVPSDLVQAPVQFTDFSWTSPDETYAHFTATVEKAGDLRVIVAKQTNAAYEVRFTIDPAKKVLVKYEDFHSGKLSTSRTYSDFVEVGGMWWATKSEYTIQGKRSSSMTQTVAAPTAEKFAEQMKAATADRATVQFFKALEVTVAEAKKKLAAGTASIDDQYALLNHFAGYQQWAKASDHLAALEKLAADKPGVRWLRTIFLQASRRGEELRKVLLTEAAKLPALPPGDRLTVANFLYGQAQAALAANEHLELLDKLRPAYADLPKNSYQRRQWQQNRIYALQNSGKPDEAFALQKALVAEHPTDYSLQYNFAYALYNRGDRDAALAHLKKLFTKEAALAGWETNNLRSMYADWIEQSGRLPDVLAFTTEWMTADPDSDAAYTRHLSALVRTGEQEKADALVGEWLKEALVPGKVSAAAQAKFRAAAHLAIGRGHSLYTDRIDPKWMKPLAEAVRFFANHETASGLADTITQSGQFRDTDEGRTVYRELFDQLLRDAATMPTPRLTQRLNMISVSNFEVKDGTWAALGQTLRDRWVKVEDANQKYWLGQAVMQYHAARLDREAYLAFLRQQWKDGPEAYQTQALHNLFEALLVTEWTGEREAELFMLLPQLGDGDARTGTQVAQLHRLTDQMVSLRNALLLKDLKNPEKLTRTELAAKHTELLNAARRGYTERLAKAEKDLPEALRPWAKAERLYLLTRVGGDAKPQAAEVWDYLGAKPLAASPPKTDLDDLLFDRYLGMALYFATRTNSAPDLVERTRKYLDAGIAAEPNEAGWKTAKFQLLVVLDKPTELEAALTEWTKAGDADGRWRTALGYVLAEQGKLAEAITLFEAVEKSDELGYVHYQALADWYMAVNKKDAYETAQKQAYRALDENLLSQLVYAKAQVWGRGVGQMPTELDKDTLRIFAAVFEKSSYPANFLHSLRQVYGQSRDFRLLAVMCDAVIGQSAGKIYPFLGTAQVVLSEVRDEATADEMLAHIEKLRAKAQTTIDHRALDLLELQVRRRMAEVKNQPGPAAEKALIAMKRAFDRDWADGERLMMSNLLRDFGHITRPDLAEEQFRELKELHAAAKAGTNERMQMAHNYGTVLGHHSRHAEAIDLMRKAMTEYATATHGGAFTSDLQGILTTTMYFHETLKQYDRAEELYLTAAKKPANDQLANWLAQQLNELYLRALDRGHAVSLGEGAALYKALEAKLVKEIGHPDPVHNVNLVNVLGRVYRTAQARALVNVAADLKAFAQKTVPPMLAKHPSNYNQLVNDVARTIRDLIGAEEGVVFVLDRIDDEPAWLRLNNQDGWSQQGYVLAQWRAEAKTLAAKTEARLLKLTLAELRKDLRSHTPRNRHIYTANHSYYWPEKEAEFAKVAEEIYAERKASGSAVGYLAEYFYHGCNRPDRAIEVMFAAHSAKLLDTNQQLRLVDYLFWRSRHAEAIPILLALVEKSPETLHYRSQLCFAYYHSGRIPELKTAFATAETFFRDKNRWGEPAMSVLAHIAVECQLHNHAVTIYGELIPHHQRTAANRGIGDGTLTTYYANLARAHAGLGNTIEAVDAASGAVVAWGNNINGRTQSLATLQSVLTNSPDLDKFVEHLDKQTGETGLLNPVVRKATGQAYFNKSKFQQATMQLQAALSVQPNDAETHQLLLRCYDLLKQPDAAVAQVLRGLELSRRDIAQYQNLGDRFVAMGRGADAERAYTSIVEVTPNEAEGHALLADIRQKQDRWTDAIKHWEEVAKIRALEPTGLLGLAAAQIHLKQWDAAAATVAKLKAKPWPAHVPNVPERIAELERIVNAAKK